MWRSGLIGSNFVHYILETYPHYEVVNYDKLTYAGNLDNLKDIESNLQFSSRYTFIHGDICDSKLLSEVIENIKLRISLTSLPRRMWTVQSMAIALIL